AFFALVEDDGARPELIDDLAAGAARGARNSVVVFVGDGGHGDGANLEFRPGLGDSGKDRGTLGAVGQSVRSILDVASHEDLAFCSEDGCAHSKFGEG